MSQNCICLLREATIILFLRPTTHTALSSVVEEADGHPLPFNVKHDNDLIWSHDANAL